MVMKEKCSATIEKRIVTFNESFRQRMHSKVSKQLYPEHRLLFSFLLASKTMQHSQLIDPEEWEFFVGNQFTEVEFTTKPTEELTDAQWRRMLPLLVRLDSLKKFKGIC